MTVNAMDRFIDGIELAAAAFIGIVAVDIFVSVLLRYLFSASIPDSLRLRPAAARHPHLLGHRGDQLSRRPHHGRPRLGRGGPAREARNRCLRDAGAAVRGHRSDRDAVRQGAHDARRPRPDLRSSSADLAVLRRRLGGRRLRRHPHRGAHVSAHFSPRKARPRSRSPRRSNEAQGDEFRCGGRHSALSRCSG